jgi:hypothetical protein
MAANSNERITMAANRRNRAAHIKRIEREGRERDMNAPAAGLSDNMLAGTIYRLQGRLNTREARLYGTVDETVKARLAELLAESRRRRQVQP